MRTGEKAPEKDGDVPAIRERLARSEARIDVLSSDMTTARMVAHDLAGTVQRHEAQVAAIIKGQENLVRIERNMDEQRADLAGHRAEAGANFITLIGRIQALDDKTDAAMVSLGEKTNASTMRVNGRIDKLIWSAFWVAVIGLGWLIAWMLTHGIVTVHA
jgi:hypothetical protein